MNILWFAIFFNHWSTEMAITILFWHNVSILDCKYIRPHPWSYLFDPVSRSIAKNMITTLKHPNPREPLVIFMRLCQSSAFIITEHKACWWITVCHCILVEIMYAGSYFMLVAARERLRNCAWLSENKTLFVCWRDWATRLPSKSCPGGKAIPPSYSPSNVVHTMREELGVQEYLKRKKICSFLSL